MPSPKPKHARHAQGTCMSYPPSDPVATDVAALDSGPWAHLEDSDHQLVGVTGPAPWQDPLAPPHAPVVMHLG